MSHFSLYPEVRDAQRPVHYTTTHLNTLAAEEKNLKIKIAKINLRIRTNEWMMIPILALSGQHTVDLAHYREREVKDTVIN